MRSSRSDPVEEIVFVLGDAGVVVGDVFGKGFSALIEGLDATNVLKPRNLDADVGEAQASFFALFGAMLVGQYGVDVDAGFLLPRLPVGEAKKEAEGKGRPGVAASPTPLFSAMTSFMRSTTATSQSSKCCTSLAIFFNTGWG